MDFEQCIMSQCYLWGVCCASVLTCYIGAPPRGNIRHVCRDVTVLCSYCTMQLLYYAVTVLCSSHDCLKYATPFTPGEFYQQSRQLHKIRIPVQSLLARSCAALGSIHLQLNADILWLLCR